MPIELLLSYSQTLAFLFVAAAALLFIYNQRKEHNRVMLRSSMEFLATYSKGMIIPLEAIHNLTPQEFTSDVSDDPEQNDYREELLAFMNSYEFISLNVRKGIIDEELTKEFMFGSFIQAFKVLQFHIIAIRESTRNPKLYTEFEYLARKWEDKR